MNNVKKIGLLVLVGIMTFTLVGCQTKKQNNVEGSLKDLMAKVYGDLEETPALMETEVTSENSQYYLGIGNENIKEALASEPMMGSFAHSIVLVRIKDNTTIDQMKKDIKEKVDPRKWICVGVEPENVIVDSIGDLIILIMDNENGSTYHNNFKALTK